MAHISSPCSLVWSRPVSCTGPLIAQTQCRVQLAQAVPALLSAWAPYSIRLSTRPLDQTQHIWALWQVAALRVKQLSWTYLLYAFKDIWALQTAKAIMQPTWAGMSQLILGYQTSIRAMRARWVSEYSPPSGLHLLHLWLIIHSLASILL